MRKAEKVQYLDWAQENNWSEAISRVYSVYLHFVKGKICPVVA